MHLLAETTAVAATTGNITIGLAAAGAAIGVGLVGGRAAEAVGRNPGAFNTVITMAILAMAFAEGIFFIVALIFNH